MDFEIVSTVLLADIEGAAPGPIHSLVSDPLGNLYYSDEMNHRVVSTDPRGQLRWRRGGKGDGRGHFQYPKGLALGYASQAGRNSDCLAVCDSWNRRVQVFGLNGDLLASWCGSGDAKLQEVVDIRFLTRGLDSETDLDTWLILDRGAHRIRLFTVAGESLGAIGRALPGHLEPAWAQKLAGSFAEAAPGGVEADLHFDPLYYPACIFGNSPDALLVWEPLARRLKQILGRNLLSLGRFPDQPWECIAADRMGYLCWTPAEGKIAAFGYDGRIRMVSRFIGRPISGCTSPGEVWFQDGSKLMRVRWHEPEPDGDRKGFCSPLLESVARELEQLKTSTELQEVTSHLLGAVDGALESCRGMWDAVNISSTELNAQAWQAKIAGTLELLRCKANQLDSFLGRQSLTLLKVRYLRNVNEFRGNAAQPSGRPDVWEGLADSLNRRFSQAQELQDLICVSRPDSQHPRQDTEHVSLQFLDDSLEKILRRVASAVQTTAGQFFFPCSGSGREKAAMGRISPGRLGSQASAGRSNVREWLREIDRISLGESTSGSKAGPYGFTSTSDNHVFVVLRLARRILELSPEGKVLGAHPVSDEAAGDFDPLYIAADAQDRLWVTECQKHRLRILERGTGYGQLIGREDSPLGLSFPHGICRGSDGSMLVADTGNHRILSLFDAGSFRIRAGGMGSGPGKLLHPMAVLSERDHESGVFWVVDHRNHRLQKFDASGAAVAAVGSCGLGNGNLLLPHDAALSTDGCLMVVQHLFMRCLKFFSEDGTEMACVDLDFTPGCLRVHGDTLWITEADGNCIRVYERV